MTPGSSLQFAGRFATATVTLWPWWLDRQLDPESPDFVPGPGSGLLPVNCTHRSWTLVGNLDRPERAAVDPRGLVTPWSEGWSLDWWIGADDRWHLPSRDAAVRQRLVGDAPVVETAMRIPGGDAVQRVYGVVPATTGDAVDHAGGVVVAEFENRSPVPFVLALAIRPANPVGAARVGSVRLEGLTVFVDDRPALLLPRAPARTAGSGPSAGDVLGPVLDGSASVDPWFDVRDDAGLASAAVLFPLPHTAVLRVAMPLRSAIDVGGRRRPRSTAAESAPTGAGAPQLPGAEQVAKGWEVQTRRGMRLDLPDPRLGALVAAARRSLLLFVGGDDVVRWPDGPIDWADAAEVLTALDRFGFPAEAARVLLTLPDHQALDGSIAGVDGRLDAAGAVLYGLGEHWRLTREPEVAERLVGPVAKAVHWIEKRRAGRRARRAGNTPEALGLLPEGTQPGFVGIRGVSYRDAFWSLRGLRDAAEMLAATAQPEVAADATRFADGLERDLRGSFSMARQRLGTAVLPAGPGRLLDGGVAANLLAGALDVLPADDTVLATTVDYVRENLCVGPAVFQAADHAGLSPRLTAELGRAELRGGDARALDRLAWLVDAASPTGAWPEVVHPRTGDGSRGQGHHGATTAAFLTLVRELLVRETGDGLALCSLWPGSWRGRGLEVHEAPTGFGRLSFAVRWHGERPALLWDLVPHPDVGTVRLTVPGLDPTWSTTEPKGEALLQPIPSTPSDEASSDEPFPPDDPDPPDPPELGPSFR